MQDPRGTAPRRHLRGSGLILLDTNILVHATTQSSARHAKAKTICEQVYKGQLEGCVTFQNLCEWYGVMTDPRRITPPLSVEAAARELEIYLSPNRLALLAVTPGVMQRLPNLLRRAQSRGSHLFDVLLVATMLEHGVDTLYTENTRDFSAFREIRVANPLA